MNTKLHAVTDANGHPLSFFMTAGQSATTPVRQPCDELPKAQWLLGDRGYDADWFRDALEAKGIQPCIPGRKSRNEPVRYDKRRSRRRSRIGIMFGRLKDWAASPLATADTHHLLFRRRARSYRHLVAMINES
jgi:transposase